MILDRLPSHSQYVVAKKNDPDVALDVARRLREGKAEGKPLTWKPSAAEWSLTLEMQAALIDRLGEAVALLADLPIAGKRRRSKPPKRVPRPETGIEKAERQLALEHYESILEDVARAQQRYRDLRDAGTLT